MPDERANAASAASVVKESSTIANFDFIPFQLRAIAIRHDEDMSSGGLPSSCELKDGRISDVPVGPRSLEGFQAPVPMRPCRSKRRITFVNLLQQIGDWLPTQLDSDLRSNIQVHPRDEQVSSRRDESRHLAETSFGIHGRQVAKEAVGDHDVARPERIGDSWILHVANVPGNSFPQGSFHSSISRSLMREKIGSSTSWENPRS